MAGLRVVRMERGASTVVPVALGPGAARPTLDGRGLVAYIRLTGGSMVAGSLWVTDDLGDNGTELAAATGSLVGSAAFAPEPNVILIGRIAPAGNGSAGIWLVNQRSGVAERLSADGWLPGWLP